MYNGGAKRFKRLENAFKDPMTKYLYFFSGVLPAFKQTNLLLQEKILAFTWCIVNSVGSCYN